MIMPEGDTGSVGVAVRWAESDSHFFNGHILQPNGPKQQQINARIIDRANTGQPPKITMTETILKTRFLCNCHIIMV